MTDTEAKRCVMVSRDDFAAAIAAMQPAPQEPVAWLYAHPDDPFPPSVRTDRHDKYDFAAMAKRGWTETPLYAHPPAPQWYGIETAPRDGTVIWGYGTIQGDYGYTENRQDVVKTRWDRADKCWRFAQPTARHDPLRWKPTHWMPLPTPPAGGSDAE